MSLKHEKTFEEARAREPTLAAHASILSVLAVMNDESERRYAEREALTRALVREQQERPGPFWAAVLLIAYAPMLLRLRGRICGDAFARDDLDQMALEAFLEAVGRFPLAARPTRVAMYLRQDTQRAVFRRLRAEQQARLRLTVLEEEALAAEEFDLFASGANGQPLDDDEREELVAMLVARVGDRVPPAKLEVVIATHLGVFEIYEADPAIATAIARGLGDVLRARLPEIARPRATRGLAALRALLNEIDRTNEITR